MTEASESSVKTYALAEIAKHNSNNSSWIVIHNNIYDVTAFLNEVRMKMILFSPVLSIRGRDVFAITKRERYAVSKMCVKSGDGADTMCELTSARVNYI